MIALLDVKNTCDDLFSYFEKIAHKIKDNIILEPHEVTIENRTLRIDRLPLSTFFPTSKGRTITVSEPRAIINSKSSIRVVIGFVLNNNAHPATYNLIVYISIASIDEIDQMEIKWIEIISGCQGTAEVNGDQITIHYDSVADISRYQGRAAV